MKSSYAVTSTTHKTPCIASVTNGYGALTKWYCFRR